VYLFGVLASHGKDPGLKTQALQIADQYLTDPASVDPTLGQIALGVAAKSGDAALFDRLQKIYETSSDPELQEIALRELVAFTNPDLLERGLEYSVSAKVRNQDSAYQFDIALRIPENRDQAWKFINTHWDQVQAEFTTEMGSYLVEGTGSFCTVEARDDVKNFFAGHSVPATGSTLRHALEHIDGCIELRRLQEPNLKQWLAAQGQ
jgi:aminopeptidase N/puromycin-sensitive aminopeptidase